MLDGHHRVRPKARGPERGSRYALIVIAHVFSWPPVRLRHVRSGDQLTLSTQSLRPTYRTRLMIREHLFAALEQNLTLRMYGRMYRLVGRKPD